MSRSDQTRHSARERVGKAPRNVQSSAAAVEVPGGYEAVALAPLTVRIPTAMALTGIGRSKLYELIASGDVDIVKVGTATLITMASLRRLAKEGAK